MTSVSSATSALAALQALSLQNLGAGQPSNAALEPTSHGGSKVTQDTVASASPASLFTAVDGVGQALSAADAAGAAGQAVLGLLQQMRQAAADASNPSATEADRAGLDQGFQQSAAQIAPTLSGATVNGVNLVDGSMTVGMKVPLGDGASTSLTPTDLSLGGPTLALPTGASVATATAAASSFASLGSAIGAASGALSTLQEQADRIDAHASLVQTLGQALASPTDDSGDSMRLLALQVSQQLAGQSVSVANAAPQSVLSLFRS